MSRLIRCAMVWGAIGAVFPTVCCGQEAFPRPSEAEAKIEAALKETANFDFVERPLSEVFEQLSATHKIPIQLDNKSLADEGMGADTPVTARIEGISLRSALRLMLAELDLTYVIRDEALFVTTKTEAENLLIFKVYPVRDLVLPISGFEPPEKRARAFAGDYLSLDEIITTCVEPTSWEFSGPAPQMEFHNSRAIAFLQTADIHEQTAELLAALRRTRDKQLVAARTRARAAERPAETEPDAMEVKVYAPHLSAGMGGGFFALPAEPAGATGDGEAPNAATAATPAAPASPREQDAQKALASAASMAADEQWRDKRAREFAALLPELVAPESWEPHGKGFVRVLAGALVIRQSKAVHREISRWMAGMSFGFAPGMSRPDEPSATLAPPGPQTDWPQEAEPAPNAREAAIEKALAAKFDFTFVETPLAEVVETIRRETKIEVQLDRRAITDQGLGADSPITRRISGISLQAALRPLLDELDMTYAIRDEVLLLTTKTEAENLLQCKVYPVFDLAVRPADSPPTGGAVDYDSLIETIRSNVDPSSWDQVGGPGSIQSFANAGAIVVRYTTQGHAEIARLLRALRDAHAATPQTAEAAQPPKP